jgi:all-beta uncharacterized protein/S-layer family protein
MPKRKSKNKKPLATPTHIRRPFFIVIGSLLVSVFVGGVILADWGTLWPAGSRKGAQATPNNLSATMPSREYMYAGGRLVATEDPTTISPSGMSFSAKAHSNKIVNVTAQAGANWSAVSNNSWITVPPGSGGSGNGTVTYSVDPNTGSSIRSGTITIAERVFTVWQGISFPDVPQNHTFYEEIGRLVARGVTVGCGFNEQGQLIYCPDSNVTREQMAAFIIRAVGMPSPPQPLAQRFNDVPPSNAFYAFIEQMGVRQITVGCVTSPPQYCPAASVAHDQMSAFILRGRGEYSPPTPPIPQFQDVQPGHPFYAFIHRMAALGIWPGCGGGNYCPSSLVTRDQMAAILVRGFNL